MSRNNVPRENIERSSGIGNEQNDQKRLKKTPVSIELRKRTISLALEGNGNCTIGRILGIPRTTVATIVSKYYANGSVEAKVRGGNYRGKLSMQQKEAIKRWVDDDCLLTLKDLVQRVQAEFHITVSKSCVYRCLRGFHYTIKNVLPVPAVRISERTIQLRFDYAQNFRNLEQNTIHESFLFLDEVGFKVCTRPKRGRSFAGVRATTTVPLARSRNISVVAVMNRNKLLYRKIHDRAVNGENFQNCLNELRERCIELFIDTPVLIMDNARRHHYRNLDFHGFRVLYPPP
jgi:transposase